MQSFEELYELTFQWPQATRETSIKGRILFIEPRALFITGEPGRDFGPPE
jgi:hypothetical protein